MNPTDTNPQTPYSTQSAPEAPATFKSGVYWRKSLWNGAKTVPSILSIKNDILTLKSDRETAFQVPISTVEARFTKYRTLVIKTGGKKYDITGVGAAISRKFTDEQKEELVNNNANTPTNLVAGGLGANALGVGLGGAGAAASVAGNIAAIAGFMIGAKELEKWKTVFEKAGVYKA